MVIIQFYLDSSCTTSCSKLLLYLTELMTPISCIIIIIIWITQHELQSARLQQRFFRQFWKSARLRFIIPHLLLLLVQPYSFLNDITITNFNLTHSYPFEYKLNYLLTIFSMYKFSVVMKCLMTKSHFYSCSAYRICKIYEANFNYIFVIKNWFKSNPITLMVVFFIWNVMMFSFSFQVLQGQMINQQPKHGFTYTNGSDSLSNSIWFTVVTLTTVGYGDNTPRTLYGRLLTTILIIQATFVVSIMVVVFTNGLFTNLSEKRIVTILNRLSQKQDESLWAVNMIGNFWKKRKLDNKLGRKRIVNFDSKDKSVNFKDLQTQKKTSEYQDNLFKAKQVRRQLHLRRQQTATVSEDTHEQLERQFQIFLDQVNKLMVQQKDCQQMVLKYMQCIDDKQN